MGSEVEKLILIGIDSLMLDFVEKFVREGIMPHICKLMSEGSYGYAMPSMPTFTPPNWTTIVTGADPSLHGVKGWVFSSEASKVKHLWTIAAKRGKKVVLIRYPGGWPSTHRNIISISNGSPHHGIGVIEEATAYTLGKVRRYSGGLHGSFESRAITFNEARGWSRLPESALPPKEARIDLIQVGGFPPTELWLLVYSQKGRGYDRLAVFLSKEDPNPLCELREGEWSDFLRIGLRKGGEVLECVFRFKLVELAPDLSRFSLFRTQIHALSGFTDPPEICEELVDNVGPFLDNPSRFCLAHGWYETYFEELREHIRWIVETARYLKDKYRWELLFTHCQSPDYVKHECWAGIDPLAPGYSPDKEEEYWDIFRRAYQLMDEFIGGLAELADESTLVVIVSDHGHVVRMRVVFLADILRDNGFLVYDKNGNIDKRRSLVRGFTHDGILLNVAWRYKDGIIKSKEEYVDLVYQIIDALLSITDEGRHVIYIAIPGWEAYALGLSEDDGDIIVCPRPGYSLVKKPAEKLALRVKRYIGYPDPKYGMWGGAESIHEGLPSARISIGTNMGMFIMRGPGIKKGHRCARPIWLKDLTPTICHLMRLPIPKGANGRVLYELLE